MADLDECDLHLDSCDINADCKNTIGSYECQCSSGYRGNGLICNGNVGLLYYDNVQYPVIMILCFNVRH